ncbi:MULTISPECIES: hypothetical protein [unclassified Streptomyces]|uniref:hypothetical protein n=1 Tax=unclassified Streptomyces TaxID=2593676 RepID=UPI00278BFA23|nr:MULTISPECIES: hypothetical protein [unclassified Streptomyces]
MELTADQLVSEFQDAVMELYFARKRIAALEAENQALRSRLPQDGATVTED